MRTQNHTCHHLTCYVFPHYLFIQQLRTIMIENCMDWWSSWLSNLVTLYICRFVLVLSWNRHLCKNWLNGMNSLEKVEVDPKTIGIWEELDFVFFVSDVHIRIQTCQYIIDKKNWYYSKYKLVNSLWLIKEITIVMKSSSTIALVTSKCIELHLALEYTVRDLAERLTFK
jgi:hypothetical protein